jgi:hypothetical protein
MLLLFLKRCRQFGFHDRSAFACAKGSAGTTNVTLLMQNMRAVLGRSGKGKVMVQPGKYFLLSFALE